jgi:hypothetical protein
MGVFGQDERDGKYGKLGKDGREGILLPWVRRFSGGAAVFPASGFWLVAYLTIMI